MYERAVRATVDIQTEAAEPDQSLSSFDSQLTDMSFDFCSGFQSIGRPTTHGLENTSLSQIAIEPAGNEEYQVAEGARVCWQQENVLHDQMEDGSFPLAETSGIEGNASSRIQDHLNHLGGHSGSNAPHEPSQHISRDSQYIEETASFFAPGGEEISDADNVGDSAFTIEDLHLTDIEASENQEQDEEHNLLSESQPPDRVTEFAVWVSQCRAWIDLFYNHGLSQAVMDEALSLLCCPYKSWKTIAARLREDSGISDAVTEYLVGPGHMCFYSEEVVACTVCGAVRAPVQEKHSPKMHWMKLQPRLRSWFLNKERCEQLYQYLSSAELGNSEHSRDWFDSTAYQRISRLYGGHGAVRDDIYLGVSTDGFQAFRNKCYDVWPIAAIVLNLPPYLRFCIKNVVPFSFIPGPSEPQDLQSFFEPLIAEIEGINEEGGWEFDFRDGQKKSIRVHILWFTGDLPAVKKMAGLKGHNGRLPCRYCKIEGIWTDRFRHTYYPLVIRDEGRLKKRYEGEIPPIRAVEESLTTIAHLSSLRGRQKADLQTATGIVGGSNLFRLPNIFPYESFPIDIMHLFYNVAKDMIRLWCESDGEDYSLSRNAMQQIDAELQKFGDGISSEIGSRPRPISRYKDWKSAEIKAFILSYSLVVLDGQLPGRFLSGWKCFVELVELCWRPVLTSQDIEDVGVLAANFCSHYEKYYYRYDAERINCCKYVFHLLLHLKEGIKQCGPPVGYSQYWMERYIGWVVGRMKAKNLAAASLFRSALFGEAYKMYFGVPFLADMTSYENVEERGGYQLIGKEHKYWLSYESNSDVRFLDRLRSYLIRKYNGMTASEAESIIHEVEHCNIKPRLQFLSGAGTQTACGYYGITDWDDSVERKTGRARWTVACEMESDTGYGIYYGRVLKFIEFDVASNHSDRWSHWEMKHEVALLDWVAGLEIGAQGQVYKNCDSTNAFSAATVEDASVIRRLISVVDHVVPTRYGNPALTTAGSRSTMRRGRKRCYFIDDCIRSDHLLEPNEKSVDGANRNLCGRRGH